MSEALKIMAVSLMGGQKSKAYAAYNGEQLVITAVSPISGFFSSWKKPLVEDIEAKKKAGYIVLIEEKTDLIAQHGTRYLLEDVEERSNLYDALDWYFALQDMGNLIAAEGGIERFIVRSESEGQKIQKKQDDHGRSYYDIEWRSFTGGHRAVLLCVVAAMTEPVSDRYLEALYGRPANDLANEPENGADPTERFQRSIFRQAVSRGREIEKARARLARITKPSKTC